MNQSKSEEAVEEEETDGIEVVMEMNKEAIIPNKVREGITAWTVGCCLEFEGD